MKCLNENEFKKTKWGQVALKIHSNSMHVPVRKVKRPKCPQVNIYALVISHKNLELENNLSHDSPSKTISIKIEHLRDSNNAIQNW